MDYQKLVTVMRRLSLEAGDKIMEIYGTDDFEVKTKSDESPVTIADEAADKIISDVCALHFPMLCWSPKNNQPHIPPVAIRS